MATRRLSAVAGLAGLVLLTMGAEGALARASIRPAAQPTSINALDDLLEQKKYAELGETLEREFRAGRGAAARQWQDRRLRDGASAYLGFVYSRELMRSVRTAPRQRQKALREQAAFTAIYTMAVLTIDGPRCADASAATRRAEQLFDLAEEAFAWAASMPEAKRDRLIDQALELERQTALLRADDDFICRGGAEDVARALQDPHSRVERKDGPDGGVVVTPSAPPVAEFVDAGRSRPLQALARRTIRADLHRMLDQMRG